MAVDAGIGGTIAGGKYGVGLFGTYTTVVVRNTVAGGLGVTKGGEWVCEYDTCTTGDCGTTAMPVGGRLVCPVCVAL